jgi:hypothetical protein
MEDANHLTVVLSSCSKLFTVSSGTAGLCQDCCFDRFSIQVNNVMLLAPMDLISTLSSDLRITNGSRCKYVIN